MTEKASKEELPLDSVKIEVAARLLGLTTARISQLVRSGHAISPARSYVRLPSLVAGYTPQEPLGLLDT
jgi:plasmid maintenance system antidote protein VapI